MSTANIEGSVTNTSNITGEVSVPEEVYTNFNIHDLRQETGITDEDELAFYDVTGNAHRKIPLSYLKSAVQQGDIETVQLTLLDALSELKYATSSKTSTQIKALLDEGKAVQTVYTATSTSLGSSTIYSTGEIGIFTLSSEIASSIGCAAGICVWFLNVDITDMIFGDSDIGKAGASQMIDTNGDVFYLGGA